ncbi:hypothetical protein JL39_27050 [Rhizobium sp. YS-1r]|nr:hypothetical protein JL39_27050 [Rhizobium sp. YS-1r]
MMRNVLVGDVSFLVGQDRFHVSLPKLGGNERQSSQTTAAISMQPWKNERGVIREQQADACRGKDFIRPEVRP